MKKIISILFLVALLLQSCKKEQEPEVFGDWETISAVGFKWEYRIERSGLFCRTLPEYFDTWFCFDFEQGGNTLIVYAAKEEVWKWEFEADDVAVVTVKIPDEQDQMFVLRRK